MFPLSSLCMSATSTGVLQGLDNTNGGVCRSKSMKLVLRVGQSKYFMFVCVCVDKAECVWMKETHSCLTNCAKGTIATIVWFWLLHVTQWYHLLSGITNWSDNRDHLFILLKGDCHHELSQIPNSDHWQLKAIGIILHAIIWTGCCSQ